MTGKGRTLTIATLAYAAFVGSAPIRGEDAPKPTDLKTALAAIDLKAFPMPDGVGRITKTSVGSHFSLPKGKPSDVAAFQRKTLTGMGWTEIDDPQAKYESEQAAQLFFSKNGLILYASIGVSPADQDLNAGLFFVGNIDARTLPKFPDAKVVNATPARLILETDAKPDDIRAHYRKEMEAKGWRHYYAPQPMGYPDEVIKEIRSKEVRFLQNAIGVEILMIPQEGKMRLFVSAELQPVQFPLPDDAANLEFRKDPPYLFCHTAMQSEKAVPFYEKEMKELGWTPDAPSRPDDKRIVKLRCERKDEPECVVSFLPIDKGCIVEITQKRAK